MKDREPRNALVGVVKGMCEDLRLEGETSLLARGLYVSLVTMPFAFVRYPGALLRAGFMIGDQESLKRDREILRKVPQPSFLRERK